jgi:hypothetical protein
MCAVGNPEILVTLHIVFQHHPPTDNNSEPLLVMQGSIADPDPLQKMSRIRNTDARFLEIEL